MHNLRKLDVNELSSDELKNKKQNIQKYIKLRDIALDNKLKKNYDVNFLELCDTILSINSEFTTIWNYKKEIILEIMNNLNFDKNKYFKKDLTLTANLLRKNPKSYCVWHHRKWISDYYQINYRKELKLCELLLNVDERNFHCWNYRRFVVKKYNIPLSEELNFTTEKIEQNFSNLSAWHYRIILLEKLMKNPEFKFDFDKEYKLLYSSFYTEPDDESTWIYIRWLWNKTLKERKEYKKNFIYSLKIILQLIKIEPSCKRPRLAAIDLIILMKENGINLDYFDLENLLDINILKNIDKDRKEFYMYINERLINLKIK